MKKICLALALIFILNINIAYSNELPHEFWGINEKYAEAVENNDDYKIIEYAGQIVGLLENLPVTPQVCEIMGSRLDQMGLAYERSGNWARAGECYLKYIPYAQRAGWEDGVKIAKAKALQYNSIINVYIKKERAAPKVLVGTNFDGEARMGIENLSMILVYLEFGDEDFTWIEKTLKEAEQGKKTVELALNLPGEGGQITSVLNSEKYLVKLFNTIEKYKSVDVLLRFAAEMNIWTNMAKPQDYVAAFRFVHNLSKTHTTNTKTVWSVNQVSNWNINMDEYYPGDDYVDYVGISSYYQKYFLGRNDWSESERFNEVVFLTGNNADPVKAVSEVIATYGDRKPVIIAEGGASHYIRTVGEDTTDWAILQLKKAYHYIPVVYPQVKLMAYFDRSMPNEANEYSLSANKKIVDEYKNLTKLDHFKGNVQYDSLSDTLEIEQRQQELLAYVHIYAQDNIMLDYYIDGVLAASAGEIPYSANIDFGGYQLGTHNLKVVARYGGDVLYEKSWDFNLTEREISVYLNGKKLLFEADPIILNDSTLVPLRTIFEALRASVLWEGETQSITSKLNGITVKMQIGSKTMYKNGNEIQLLAEPVLHKDKTMVPVRAIAEAFGADVEWENYARKVLINY